MSIKTMEDLFVNELRDLYHAEKQLLKALPKMRKAASSDELKQLLETHLEETHGQVEKLEQVFEMLDLGKRAKRCEAMEGLITEGQEIIEEVEDPEARDAGLIVAQQKVEHYEIAGYGSAVAMAKQLGKTEAMPLLQEILEQEKATDQKLNQLALGRVNKQAQSSGKKAAVAEQPKEQGRSGGSESGSGGAGQSQGEKQNLKTREYRDKEGELHHHTTTYMEQHAEDGGKKGSSANRDS